VIEAVRATAPDVRFLALSVSDAAEDVIGLIRYVRGHAPAGDAA
jgi:hypothetical protein